MLSNKFGGIAGAAMLGTAALLGTNAANALIDLDGTDQTVTFSKETLTATVDDPDYSSYYVVRGGNGGQLDVTAFARIEGDGSNRLVLTYTLENMIFTDGSNLEVGGVGTARKATGGMKGDSIVVYTATRGAAVDHDSPITLSIAELGILADAPGSITMMLRDTTLAEQLAGIPGVVDAGVHTATEGDAVRVASSIMESKIAIDQVATVQDKFLKFGDNLMVPLGSVTIGVDTTHQKANGEGVVVVADVYGGTGNAAITADADVPDGESTVTISGDFSFASSVWLDDTSNDGEAPGINLCNDGTEGTPVDLRMADDDGPIRDATDLRPQPVQFVSERNLCIAVLDPDDPANKEDLVSISETDPYMATATYTAGGTTGAKFAAVGAPQALGMITRDGTTVHIPVLMVSSDRIHRITIANRGNASATYVMSFSAPEGSTADPESMEGTLDPKSVTEFNAVDIVSVDIGRRAAATIIIEAQPRHIDVASQIQLMGSWNTDTLIHDIPD